MRLTALGAGVLLSFVIVSANADQVQAQSITVASLTPTSQKADKLAVMEKVQEQVKPEVTPAPLEPTKHVVAENENLSKIAEKHQTTWKRIYDKNTQVADPDVVNAGVELVIPSPEEQLTERAVPVDPEPVVVAPEPATSRARTTSTRPQAAKPAPRQQSNVARGNASGNTYTPGQCTWYVKNRRGGSLPNGLGNADQWFARAQAMGMSTGHTPQVGAAGVRPTGQHAVYVEAVHGNGTITISEMNYNYSPYSQRTRTANASDFIYIY